MKALGWTLKAVGLTNTPATAQRKNKIAVYDHPRLGRVLRIPVLKRSKFVWNGREYTFGQKELDQIIKNWKSQAWDYEPFIKVGHTNQDEPALASFGPEDGEVVQEDINGESYIVVYARPTDEDAFNKAKKHR